MLRNTATYVWDISDMDAPVLKTVFKSEVESIDHNQYIYRGYTFQSNYEAGLRILWLDQETWTLTQTGFFDVYPPSTTAQFRGTWSNYPYNLPMGESLISILVAHLNLCCET
jgi:choice-of-anchor B domain-containing protein